MDMDVSVTEITVVGMAEFFDNQLEKLLGHSALVHALLAVESDY
jgi:hypothetical protein